MLTQVNHAMRSSVRQAVYLSGRLVRVNVVVDVVAGRSVAQHAGAALVQVNGALAGVGALLDAGEDGESRVEVVSCGRVENNVAGGSMLGDEGRVVEVAQDSLDACSALAFVCAYPIAEIRCRYHL